MTETVAVLGTFQTPFKTHHPDHTFAEQAQIAAAGALRDAGMTPGDIDAIVFSLAPTYFMELPTRIAGRSTIFSVQASR